VGFVDNVALGQVFSEYFGFPLPIFIPPVAPQSPSSIIWGWFDRPVVAAVPSGLGLTALRIIIIKNNTLLFRMYVLWHVVVVITVGYHGFHISIVALYHSASQFLCLGHTVRN
jgi:hypothetical protein